MCIREVFLAFIILKLYITLMLQISREWSSRGTMFRKDTHWFLLKRCLLIGILSLTAPVVAGEKYAIQQYLNVRGNFGGEFVPDSNDIMFRNKSTGVYQAWRVSNQGGWAEQVTWFEEGIDYCVVHPVTGQVIFGADQGGNERRQLWLCDSWGRNLEPLTDNPDAKHGFGGWSRNGRWIAYSSNARSEKDFDVYVMDLTTRKVECIWQQGGYWDPAGFSPDGKYLALFQYTANDNSELYLYDLETKETIYLTPHTEPATYRNPSWSMDSQGFYFTTNQDREFYGMAYYDLSTRSFEWMETPDWDVGGASLSWNGRYLHWYINVNGIRELHIRDMHTGEKIKTPTMPFGQISGVEFSTDESKMMFEFESPTQPEDIWVWEVRTGELRKVTHAFLAGIPPSSFQSPRCVKYLTFDGLEIPAFYYLPEDWTPGTKVPVIVKIHGGPESQARPEFDRRLQYFLNKGYAVFVPNVRGSAGYGKTYAHLDNVKKRLDSVEDIEYAAKWMADTDWADTDRMVVYGGSYGGYMVLACLTEQPDIWAGGIDVVGISNFVTFLENTGPWRRVLRESEYGSLATDKEFLERISPLNHVDKIKAPLMIIQGANDPRVPASEAEQIYQALKSRGLDVELHMYQDEGHGIVKLTNQLDVYPKMVQFLDRVLKQ